MSATYRVPVSEVLLQDRGELDRINGFRLVSVDGPWDGHPGVFLCTFEDDGAPAELDGKLVQPVFLSHLDGPPTIIERYVLD